MTKENPNILCPSCKQFDYDMNRKGGVSFDIFVVCKCDWKYNLEGINESSSMGKSQIISETQKGDLSITTPEN